VQVRDVRQGQVLLRQQRRRARYGEHVASAAHVLRDHTNLFAGPLLVVEGGSSRLFVDAAGRLTRSSVAFLGQREVREGDEQEASTLELLVLEIVQGRL